MGPFRYVQIELTGSVSVNFREHIVTVAPVEMRIATYFPCLCSWGNAGEEKWLELE
jgi:hypothetical protein